MPFVAFIDESGEAGISRVRSEKQPGASPYFVLGAAVMQPATIINARKLLADVRQKISKEKWKHATDLDHSTKVFFAREVSRLHARFFAVVSNKETLREYKQQIDDDPQMYYNKCLKYLLERICSYLARFGVSDEDISFILERRNHDYSRMLRYLVFRV